MINPTIDTLLIILCMIVAFAICWYAHAVYWVSGKTRYLSLLGWANIAMLNGIGWLGLIHTHLTWALAIVVAICFMHGLYCGVIYLFEIVDWWIHNDPLGALDRLAEKRHGRKDK